MRIAQVIAHPLRARLPQAQLTGQGSWPEIELVVVEVRTEDGLTGWGECLGRRGARAYAVLIEEMLAPALVGREALDIAAHWAAMRGRLTGRAGGVLLEAIAGVDIALWDLAGKRAGLPVQRLLGGMGRTRVAAYASSINWGDEARAREEIGACLARGFLRIKLKIGAPVEAAIRRVELARSLVGDRASLCVDANWAFDVDDAVRVGRALEANGYEWFEEPIVPEDLAGYARLRGRLDVRLAAGESDFTVAHARDLIAARSVGLIQPDVARAGGISQTRRIAELAEAFHVDYAPHVGWSGGLCVAASLQLAAAAPNLRAFECMVFDNPLREALLVKRVGSHRDLVEGEVEVPRGPGLGVEVDPEALARYRIG